MTSGITPTTAYSSVEMGRDHHGLHSRAAQNTEWTRFNMGYSGPLNKGSAFYPSKDRLQR
jgi:hypothetical protein